MPNKGEFAKADVLVEGKKIVAVGRTCKRAARRRSMRAARS